MASSDPVTERRFAAALLDAFKAATEFDPFMSGNLVSGWPDNFILSGRFDMTKIASKALANFRDSQVERELDA